MSYFTCNVLLANCIYLSSDAFPVTGYATLVIMIFPDVADVSVTAGRDKDELRHRTRVNANERLRAWAFIMS